MANDITDSKLKAVRNAYYRNYYQEHKEERKAAQLRYWRKVAERMEDNQGADND